MAYCDYFEKKKVDDWQCLKLIKKSCTCCRSSCLESQIINIKLKKNQQKVSGPPPNWSASDRRTEFPTLMTDIQCSAIVMQLMFSQIITIDTLELSHEAELWGIFYEFNPWFWFSLRHYSAVCNMIPYWTVLWWQATVLRIQCTKAIKKKLPFCFVSAASKAVDMLLESKWGAAKSKDQALFITRSGCADYLDK